jgi:acetylglutamate kinase
MDGTSIDDLISRNKVSGGMALELKAPRRSPEGGIGEVFIFVGALPQALLTAANGSNSNGTRVLPRVPARMTMEASL